MTAGWAPGAVRARTMLSHCVGPDALRGIAALSSLDEAVHSLEPTVYGRRLAAPTSLIEAQRAIADTLVWQLRVLAGWQTRSGAQGVRLLAAGFEIANTEAHIRGLRDDSGASSYRLGSLAIAWPRLARTTSLGELRTVLARSPWGDPGAATAAAIGIGMRVVASARIADQVPYAAGWARKRVAVLVGRERFVFGRRLTGATSGAAARVLGSGALRSETFADFRRAVPMDTRSVLADVSSPEDLWRAEGRWWTDLEGDGRKLLRGHALGPAPVVGAVAVMSADVRRARAALAVAASGGGSPEIADAPV